ncbi:MAG TPA: quinone-dependent dihydroorotate dehydrogenase [Candidatus Acidoferrales bacterium]|nr:quinone-dependent dihydroorotate dehydrogenase [Candidatus Acidoferrales bacterium]
MIYKTLLRPILFLKDPEEAHEQTLTLLARVSFAARLLERFFRVTDERLTTRLGPLEFPNPVGLAAGLDKNATALPMWEGFGFGFIEIGAVTALPQPGNPKPRLYRLPKDLALINRLGFNNEGAEAISAKLGALKQAKRLPKIPLGINIGRSKIVDTENAAEDYIFTFEKLYPFADYFTLNVSSPNTPHLRDLQQRSHLERLLANIQTRNAELARQVGQEPKSVYLKIAPDMELSQLEQIIEVVLAQNLSGIAATNATAFMREKLSTPTNEPGGLSGKPLRERATAFIRHIYRSTRGKLSIIGVGGIFTAEDAYEKITAGASAVQILTGFVYEGPAAVKRINQGLLRLLERDGFNAVGEAVGSRVEMKTKEAKVGGRHGSAYV